MTRRIVAWIIGVVITGLYAYAVYAAIGNLVLLPDMGNQLGLSVTAPGWIWLYVGLLLPVIAYVLALVLARGCRAAVRNTVLFAGLCAAAAIQLEIMVLVPQHTFFA